MADKKVKITTWLKIEILKNMEIIINKKAAAAKNIKKKEAAKAASKTNNTAQIDDQSHKLFIF